MPRKHTDQLSFEFEPARKKIDYSFREPRADRVRELTVPEMVWPGTVISNRWARYIVVDVQPSFYAPERPQHYQDLSWLGGKGATDTLIPCFHIEMVKEAEFIAAPRKKSLKAEYFLNRVVLRKGRLVELYEFIDDDIVIEGVNATAEALLEEATA